MIVQDASTEAVGKLHVKLSVIVPVYNQEQDVLAAVERIKRVVASTGVGCEIIVVDDGSTDGTLNALRGLASSDNGIKLFSYPENTGKGHAVRTGIENSSGDIVIFTDGDLDISPHLINEYLRQLNDCDLVIASKAHPESRVRAPLSRKLLSRAFNLLVRILTGIPFRDTQSGLKAGNGKALKMIFNLMLVKRYAFDVELLTIANLLNLRIKEMPIEISMDRRFKIKDIVRMFVDVLAISYRYRIKRWYQERLKVEMIDALVNR